MSKMTAIVTEKGNAMAEFSKYVILCECVILGVVQ